MAELFATGRIVDLILILVAFEALALLAWRVWRGRGPSVPALASNLASGAALMLAVRAALTGSDWTVVAACLAGSLVAHVTEMCLRLRSEPPRAFDHTSPRCGVGTSVAEPAFNARRQPGIVSR